LLERAKESIEKIKEELGKKPSQASNIIKFLNKKRREELEELGIEDRISTN